MLDGGMLRTGLNSDLGFSDAARKENLRRVAYVAALFCEEGFVTVAATISPEREHRENAKRIIGDKHFVEVFVDTPIAVCEGRDPKGLYRRARRGEIPEFTGVGSRPTTHHPNRISRYTRMAAAPSIASTRSLTIWCACAASIRG